ncbi:hypothetical protein FOA52_007764 [Chlamydomonas sp. UWO 241]|nr:hypothetical protein FOA52_007764 [Chlamydomonas sp. UWO 241]
MEPPGAWTEQDAAEGYGCDSDSLEPYGTEETREESGETQTKELESLGFFSAKRIQPYQLKTRQTHPLATTQSWLVRLRM